MTTETALVTGASDGIGREFCRVLAARGFNLVLVARREDRLQAVARELQARHGVVCHVVPCDLARPQAAQGLSRTLAERGIQVDFLVNNAGLLFNGDFDRIELHKQEDLLALNVVALTALTHLMLAGMIARGHGHILNVASTAAWMGIPRQNVYAASKGYVLPFTLALAGEMRARATGVRVTALCPSYTDTRMLDNPQQGPRLTVPRFMTLRPDVVAALGVAACMAGRPLAIPGWSNRLAMALLQVLPRPWLTQIVGRLYRRGMVG